MHHELVLTDQSQLGQRQCEFHSSHEQPLARLLLELLNSLAQISAYELRVPIDLLQGARKTYFAAASIVRAKGSIQSGLASVVAGGPQVRFSTA